MKHIHRAKFSLKLILNLTPKTECFNQTYYMFSLAYNILLIVTIPQILKITLNADFKK